MYYPHSAYRSMDGDQMKSLRKEIRVSGEGVVSVSPDIAEVSLGVETEDAELKKAQTENGARISQIIESLKEMGIPEENIQTIDFSIYPQYDYVDGKQLFRGYRVNHMLKIKVPDINLVGTVVDTAVSNGANRVSNISFSISNPIQAYQRALSIAVQNAILTASTVAQTLGVNLVLPPLKVIEESRRQVAPIPFEGSQMVKSATTTPTQPGQQDVNAMVTAIFTFS